MKRTLRLPLALLALALLSPPLLRAEEREWRQAYSLDGVTRLRVENVNGGISARPWDRPYVRVEARLSGSRWALDNTEIAPSQDGDEIRIATRSLRQRHLFFFFDFGERLARVEYELLVPAGTELSLRTVNGRIDTEGRRAEQRLETVNGRIEVRDAAGPLWAHTVNGQVEVALGAPLGDSSLRTVNGSIHVAVPEGAAFRYRLSTVNGSLEALDREYRGHGWGGKSLDGEVGDDGPRLKATCVNGSIRISAGR